MIINASARTVIRKAAVQAISSFTGITCQSPGDWGTPKTIFPSIQLRNLNDVKMSGSKSTNNFTTTVTLELLARAVGDTAEEAQDNIEALGSSIEAALLGNVALRELLQQFPRLSAETKIDSTGEKHFAGLLMQIDCETFEVFDPTQINPQDYPAFSQVVLTADMISPFDPGSPTVYSPFTVAGTVDQSLEVPGSGGSGEYPNPAWPNQVVPAPRTSGPDGRSEGTLQINLPS